MTADKVQRVRRQKHLYLSLRKKVISNEIKNISQKLSVISLYITFTINNYDSFPGTRCIATQAKLGFHLAMKKSLRCQVLNHIAIAVYIPVISSASLILEHHLLTSSTSCPDLCWYSQWPPFSSSNIPISFLTRGPLHLLFPFPGYLFYQFFKIHASGHAFLFRSKVKLSYPQRS